MNSWLFSLLLGAPASAEGADPAGSFITTLIPFALIIAIFYFLIIRPQNKKQKETQNMLKTLKKGDKVVTIGGIHGMIQSVKENSVVVKVDENTKLEFTRNAISSVENSAREEKAEKSEDKKAESAIADKSSDTGEGTKS
ncbi:MAG: preprotein translocase subunit YajC [Treponema sp.]|jgi:preprotein translocase subunit YajC|nr:preprotein translocase subunit YajC [Treponema sp.]